MCVGRKSLGGIPLKTVYVTFDRPMVAAVKMVNAPAFFRSWEASIRHEDISDQESRGAYQFHFVTKPRILRFILDPLMERVFLGETRSACGRSRLSSCAIATVEGSASLASAS
jgi:hypothetical protein